MTTKKTLAALSAIMVFLTGALAATPDISQKVTDVIDGDTIVMANHQRVRLFGASSPELNNCYGPESKNYLEKLVKNKKVILAEPVGDKWGRVVALVYLGDQLVNVDLVKNGFARYEGETSSANQLFQDANEFARQNKLGIFSPQCYQTINPNTECLIKGNIDKTTGRKMYHFPGCREYSRTVVETSLGEQWFCTEAEAQKAGYIKSTNCP